MKAFRARTIDVARLPQSFRASVFGALLLVAYPVPASASTSPPCIHPCTVEVTGTRTDGTGGMGTNLSGGKNSPSLGRTEPTLAMGRVVNSLVRDVRCYGGSARTLTSRDDADSKLAAAQGMARVANGARILGGPGSLFTVTWADGGSTTYMVQSNGPTTVPLAPIPVREAPADGVPKPGQVCPGAAG